MSTKVIVKFYRMGTGPWKGSVVPAATGVGLYFQVHGSSRVAVARTIAEVSAGKRWEVVQVFGPRSFESVEAMVTASIENDPFMGLRDIFFPPRLKGVPSWTSPS